MVDVNFVRPVYTACQARVAGLYAYSRLCVELTLTAMFLSRFALFMKFRGLLTLKFFTTGLHFLSNLCSRLTLFDRRSF